LGHLERAEVRGIYRSQVGIFLADSYDLLFVGAVSEDLADCAANSDVDDLELVGLPTDAPSGGYVSDPIDVSWGKSTVTISQQLLDRGGAEGHGGSFDQILRDQIGEQLRASINLYVINQALLNCAQVTESTTLTTALWWDNINSAVEQLADTSGVRLQPTHCHSTSDFAGWVRRQVDSENRPVWIPDVGAVVMAEPTGEPFCSTGYQGINWTGGGGSWFVDDNIPNSATTPTATQVIVWNAPSVLFWSAPTPTITCYPETNANTLSVNIRAVQYCAAVAKFGSAVCAISGAGYEALN
jgi:hypothetical protein